MLVALICLDKPNSLEIRKANRAAHLEHLTNSGVVELAGPFLDADGAMCGSMIVLSVDTIQHAQDWVNEDAYTQAGLFASVDIREWKKVIG
ncbi:MAG: YciI family protein [Cypionkella sp.]